jgi:hypothetical protein
VEACFTDGSLLSAVAARRRMFRLVGANVVITAVGFKVTVETSKNHPEGFEFDVLVEDRLHDNGHFMVDYIGVMGIRVEDAGSHFACKLAKVKGIFKAYPGVRVADATMRKACKVLIADSGLDPTLYATHSCKHGAALEALKAGLTDIQIQDLGRWTSASMVARYAGGDATVRNKMVDSIRT